MTDAKRDIGDMARVDGFDAVDKLETESVELGPRARRERSWPSPLADDAFHGIIGEFVRLVAPHSESDPAALLLQSLAAVGNAIGPKPHFMVEATKHVPILFVMLIGKTSRGRKGTALDRVRELMRFVDHEWCAKCIARGLSSGEGLTASFEPGLDGLPVEPRKLVLATEFASLLRTQDRKGNTLSAVLREAWDGGALQVLTRKNPLRVDSSHTTVIAHITLEELVRELTATEIANGFANRFLLVVTKRSKRLAYGGCVDRGELAALGGRLRCTVEHAQRIERVEFHAEAKPIWEKFYDSIADDVPGILGAVTSRAEAQVLRLALVYALLDGSALIRPEHVRAALAVWRYCEESARYVFGERLGDGVADTILDSLRGCPGGMTRTQLSDLLNHNASKQRIDAALSRLESLGYARRLTDQQSGPGPKLERWIAAR